MASRELITIAILLINCCVGVKFEELRYKNCSDEVVFSVKAERGQCPPWFFNDSGDCKPGPDLGGVIQQDTSTLQTSLEMCYCMTENDGVLTVGDCIYTCVDVGLSHYPLPCTVEKLHNFTCADLHRRGTLCNLCSDGYAIPVYSYETACVECKDYQYNWLKYLAVAFLPLTVFYVAVTVFSISFTSPMLSGLVMASQIVGHPTILQQYHVLQKSGFMVTAPKFVTGTLALASLWNLDFFRIYFSFCLHPNAPVLLIMALDYVTTVYPVILIILTFILVKLHDNNFRVIVWTWKFFSVFIKPFRLRLRVKKSLIDVFASFVYLSSTRLLVTSISFLLSTTTYTYNNHNGSMVLTNATYLYNSPSVEFFGKAHLPFAIMAIILPTVFFLLPMVLIFLYPFSWFQRLLNRLRLNFIALHTFVDVFQGFFKDGSNNTKDYRSFSGFLLLNPLILNLIYLLTLSNLYYIIASIWGIFFITLHLIFQPYKRKIHNDVIFITAVSVLICAWGMSIDSSAVAIRLQGAMQLISIQVFL